MADAFTCDLCWFSFDTAEELAAHEDMERAVDWPIDGLELEDA